ncbi:MAG: elongation factor P [candidate division Zixibacteria bacterium HGW-Zixibacteria-1]|nr:MAG: elongation factor P [candidate division Zixibacteria bacterium HGW-Zixibacteria-1]
MISAGELRKGTKVMYEGNPYNVVDFLHAKMGRGRPHVKAKMKHLLTGGVIEKSFLTTESFDQPDLEHRNMQYLYSQDNEYIFMDSTTYDQIQVDEENLGDSHWYLMENAEYSLLFFEGKPISVDLPASVILTVTQTEPAVKGDTVSNVMKPATVETGYSVKVPLFVKQGDKVKIDTRTGEYIERAN